MGKNKTVYLQDDVLELIDELEGWGTIINNAIREYFANDEAHLERKMSNLTRDRDMIKAKLTELRERRMKEKTLSQRKQELNREERERKAKIDKLKQDWQEDKISDDEYWEAMDKFK